MSFNDIEFVQCLDRAICKSSTAHCKKPPHCEKPPHCLTAISLSWYHNLICTTRCLDVTLYTSPIYTKQTVEQVTARQRVAWGSVSTTAKCVKLHNRSQLCDRTLNDYRAWYSQCRAFGNGSSWHHTIAWTPLFFMKFIVISVYTNYSLYKTLSQLWDFQ